MGTFTIHPAAGIPDFSLTFNPLILSYPVISSELPPSSTSQRSLRHNHISPSYASRRHPGWGHHHHYSLLSDVLPSLSLCSRPTGQQRAQMNAKIISMAGGSPPMKRKTPSPHGHGESLPGLSRLPTGLSSEFTTCCHAQSFIRTGSQGPSAHFIRATVPVPPVQKIPSQLSP